MRALSTALFLLISWTAVHAADAQTAITICNDRWHPPCRDFPVTTFVPGSQATTGMGERYSLQVKSLDQSQLQRILPILGIDQSKIDLNSK